MPDKPRKYRTRGREAPHPRAGSSTNLRDNTAAYRRRRTLILTEMPLCAYCLVSTPTRISAATVLDHKVALSLAGDNAASNLIPACKQCNVNKAAGERRYLARGHDVDDVKHDPDLAEWLG
jgi:5-methylcytosine-specific restriction endonuclease McrA